MGHEVESNVPAPLPPPPKGLFAILQIDRLCFYLTADAKFHSYYKSHTTQKLFHFLLH